MRFILPLPILLLSTLAQADPESAPAPASPAVSEPAAAEGAAVPGAAANATSSTEPASPRAASASPTADSAGPNAETAVSSSAPERATPGVATGAAAQTAAGADSIPSIAAADASGAAASSEAGEAAGPHVVHADLRQGFELESEDGTQSLRIGGLFSARTGVDIPADGDASIGAAMRLARIMLRGRLLGSKLTYFFQSEFAGEPRLLDLELDYELADSWLLRFGRIRVPFGRQWIDGLNVLMLPDRSIVSDTFRPGRDTGVTLEGRFLDGVLEARAGAYAEARDKWPLVVARLGLAPLGALDYSEDGARVEGPARFAIGINGSYDKRTTETTVADPMSGALVTQPGPNEARLAGGIDIGVRAGRLGAFAEAYLDRIEPDGGDAVVRAGAFAQLGYFIVPGTLQAAGRFSLLAADTDVTGADGLRRYELALSHYLLEAALKVQARYGYDQLAGDDPLPWTEGHTVDAQFVLSL